MRFPISEFHRRFLDDDACLETIFKRRYGQMTRCPKCKDEFKYHRVKKRRCYACQWCSHQLYPTKGTIFQKTRVPLQQQFLVIYMMTSTRSGVAAKEVERTLDISYDTAWKLCHRIRRAMGRAEGMLSGHVEIDETYVGGVQKGKRGRGAHGKTPVFGAVERGGDVRMFVIEGVRRKTLHLLVTENIDRGAIISSDRLPAYKSLKEYGYKHDLVRHDLREYVRGDVHTQTIEGVWSRLKMSIHGTHIHVSKKHLQKYVDEFAFRFNHRQEPHLMFDHLLARVLQSQ